MMDAWKHPPQVDTAFLQRFETGLDPQRPEMSRIPARILGFGEISSIFAIHGMDGIAFKRLPIFNTMGEAESYAAMFRTYCRHLTEAGLTLPGQAAAVIGSPGGGVALYIAQRQLADQHFAHRLIHQRSQTDVLELVRAIIALIDGVWDFNQAHKPGLELALDGQLSNWVSVPGPNGHNILYIDTSTPLFRIQGKEQLDPEKLLKSAPGFLRWILRRFFLDDVMSRYYAHDDVVMDLVANLHKEQRPDLIAPVTDAVNRYSSRMEKPLTTAAVDRYYREDRIIWSLFLAFRRIDRWLTRHLFRRRYEFILPGRIKR